MGRDKLTGSENDGGRDSLCTTAQTSRIAGNANRRTAHVRVSSSAAASRRSGVAKPSE